MSRRLLAIIAILLLALAGAIWSVGRHPDALRHLVMDKCVVNSQIHHAPKPCERVNLDAGYALLKDRNGPLQYLLLPTRLITGIESPRLLEADTPNYFAIAWQNRAAMSQRLGRAIPDSAISLAINSELGRSQNLLHIHISCLRSDIRTYLDNASEKVAGQWSVFPERLNGHRYLARRLSADELADRSPFMRLAAEVPGARAKMGRYSLFLAQQSDGSFLLLATERALLEGNLAHAEELQDHDCRLSGRLKAAEN